MEKSNRFSGMSRVELDVLHSALCNEQRNILKMIEYCERDKSDAVYVWRYKLVHSEQLIKEVTDAWCDVVRTEMNEGRKPYFVTERVFPNYR